MSCVGRKCSLGNLLIWLWWRRFLCLAQTNDLILCVCCPVLMLLYTCLFVCLRVWCELTLNARFRVFYYTGCLRLCVVLTLHVSLRYYGVTEHFTDQGRANNRLCVCVCVWLVAWYSGRTSVFGRRTFSVLRSTYNQRVTTYVGKPSAINQPTKPTQPFIPSGSINE